MITYFFIFSENDLNIKAKFLNRVKYRFFSRRLSFSRINSFNVLSELILCFTRMVR